MKYLDLKFDGDKRNARYFICQLDSLGVSRVANDREIMAVLPRVLSDSALSWFRGQQSRMKTWTAFKNEFVQKYPQDYSDYWYEYATLQERIRQKHGEDIVEFLMHFSFHARTICMPPPPSREIQVKIACQNLQPEYRRAISDKEVLSLDDIKEYCLAFEERRKKKKEGKNKEVKRML